MVKWKQGVSMEERFIIRISAEEKQQLTRVANELEITLSALARSRLIGENLGDQYFELIRKRIDLIPDNTVFKLKGLIPNHWRFLSKAEKRYLVNLIIDKADEDELPIELHKFSKGGKCKFLKVSEYNGDFMFSDPNNEED
jgi:hypothetical protein